MSQTDDKKDFRWSFSQWENYNACPARWKYKSVLKLPGQPPGPAAARGLLIHSTVEDYISQRTDVAHDAVKPEYYPVMDQFRNHPNGERHCEYRMSLGADWTVSGPLNSVRAWCIMVLDAVRVGDDHKGPHATRTTPLVAYVGEWKSGKPKDTHGDQRKLYAVGALSRWAFVDEVHVTTYYLEGTEVSQRLKVPNTKSANDKLRDLWQGRVDRMQSDRICAPKPGVHCNWCDYAKKKGGPCAFGS
jgi:hypothetical protein